MKKKAIIGLVAAVVSALAVGAGFAYAQEQERQRQIEEHDQAVHALYDERKAELDEIAASVDSEADKAALFAALDELDRFEEAVWAEEDGFKLHDGASYRHGELLDEAHAHAKAFKVYVVEGYQKELDSLLIDDANAEGVTKEALAENAAALQALADEVDADAEERDVWGSEDERAAFAAKVAEAVEADNAKIAEIEEAERVEAERIAAEQKAAEQAASASVAQGYGNGYGDSGSGFNTGYSDGSNNRNGEWYSYTMDGGTVTVDRNGTILDNSNSGGAGPGEKAWENVDGEILLN